MKEVRAVIFDVDGTLSPEVSWLSLTRDLGASTEDHIHIYEAYRDGESTYDESKGSLLRLWQSTGNATRPFFQSIFENLPLLEDSAGIIVDIQKNHKVCLITGSMDMFAETVAAKLNVPDYFANTKLHWDNNDVLVDMDYELNQAKRKLEQFLGYCSLNNIQPDECVVVGDGENDIELFKASHRGVAVGGDAPESLKQVAWRSVGNLSDLPQILAV